MIKKRGGAGKTLKSFGGRRDSSHTVRGEPLLTKERECQPQETSNKKNKGMEMTVLVDIGGRRVEISGRSIHER